jgi:hypothetical protein
MKCVSTANPSGERPKGYLFLFTSKIWAALPHKAFVDQVTGGSQFQDSQHLWLQLIPIGRQVTDDHSLNGANCNQRFCLDEEFCHARRYTDSKEEKYASHRHDYTNFYMIRCAH